MKTKMKTKEIQKRVLAAVLALIMAVSTWMPAEQVKAEVVLPDATNTTIDTARQIVYNSSISETMSDSDNIRYYKFKLDAASEIIIKGSFLSRNGGQNFYIYDEDQTKVWTGYGHDSFSWDVYLTGGQYYLEVNSTFGVTFSVSKNNLKESFTETQTENNDLIDNANAIDLKKKYKGVMAENDSIDYFQFKVPAKGKINCNTLNSTDNTLKYLFYDKNYNLVYSFDLSHGSKTTETFQLAAGNYYLAVTQYKEGEGVGSYNFTIDYTASAPSKPSLTSVKNTSGKKMVVKWKKVKDISGYELQYATSSNFKKGLVKKNISSGKTSVTYTKLTKGKTYYVRMRSYVNVNGKKVYGNWSTKKSVKINK